MTEEHFYLKRRMSRARSAIRKNLRFSHEGPLYEEVIDFFEDLSSNLSDQRPDEPDAAFYYVIRCLGVVVERHADQAYGPYGYKNPFVQDTKTTLPPQPVWRYPVVNAPPGPGSTELPPVLRPYSALKMFGYTVGARDGWPREDRRAFLSAFMEMKLPEIVEQTFGDEYGAPMTTTRLRKVANVIAANASNFIRNDAGRYAVAIGHWEDDLQFLKEKYYIGHGLMFQPWPSPRAEGW